MLRRICALQKKVNSTAPLFKFISFLIFNILIVIHCCVSCFYLNRILWSVALLLVWFLRGCCCSGSLALITETSTWAATPKKPLAQLVYSPHLSLWVLSLPFHGPLSTSLNLPLSSSMSHSLALPLSLPTFPLSRSTICTLSPCLRPT